ASRAPAPRARCPPACPIDTPARLRAPCPSGPRRRSNPESDITGTVMEELVSKQLVKYLADRGVEYVFGLCGHTNIAVLAALDGSPVKFINTRHEQIAAHIADG